MVDEPRGQAADLQFDTAVPQPGTAGAAALSCGFCAQPIGTSYYFDVSGRTTCAQCRAKVATLMEPPKGAAPFALAALFGLGAGIVGAIIYYAVIVITKAEIGLVAILIGYMVGYAVRKGAGGRGGRRFQFLAVALTYLAVCLAYTPLAIGGAMFVDSMAAAVRFAFFVVALPVVVIVGSMPSGLLSAAIIFFGMMQAWRMTGLPPLVVSGPYRIGDRPASAV